MVLKELCFFKTEKILNLVSAQIYRFTRIHFWHIITFKNLFKGVFDNFMFNSLNIPFIASNIMYNIFEDVIDRYNSMN